MGRGRDVRGGHGHKHGDGDELRDEIGRRRRRRHRHRHELGIPPSGDSTAEIMLMLSNASPQEIVTKDSAANLYQY